MRTLTIRLACSVLAMALAACSPERPVHDLRLHGFLESLEIAPVLLAAEEHFEGEISLHRGGIANLVGTVTTGYGEPGEADIATNAETQLLRHSVTNPDLRVIMTVTEGNYRILARRSAGITRLQDLRGKRVGTMPNTSAAYFLERMLQSVELGLADIILVGDIDLPQFSDALVDGRIDALAMWSPEPEEAALALGGDAIAFSGEGIYREVFSLNTTAGALADPQRRGAIRHFLEAVIDADAAMARDPQAAQRLVSARMADYAPEVIEASWPHHRYLAGRVPDLLDVMVEQEQWLARVDQRAPREREALAKLIDYSLLDEIRSGAAR